RVTRAGARDLEGLPVLIVRAEARREIAVEAREVSVVEVAEAPIERHELGRVRTEVPDRLLQALLLERTRGRVVAGCELRARQVVERGPLRGIDQTEVTVTERARVLERRARVRIAAGVEVRAAEPVIRGDQRRREDALRALQPLDRIQIADLGRVVVLEARLHEAEPQQILRDVEAAPA